LRFRNRRRRISRYRKFMNLRLWFRLGFMDWLGWRRWFRYRRSSRFCFLLGTGSSVWSWRGSRLVLFDEISWKYTLFLFSRSIYIFPRIPILIFLLCDCDYLPSGEMEVILMRGGVFVHGLDFKWWTGHLGRVER